MKKFLVYLLIFIGISSCKKDDPGDYGTLKNKEWFQNMAVPCDKNAICKTYIYKATYDNVPVVYSIPVGALCDAYFSVQLHNLDGEVIKSYVGPGTLSAFGTEVTNKELIYRCDE